MGLISGGVALANSLTQRFGMQCTIMWYAYTGQDGFGAQTFAAGVPLQAVVDQTAKQVQAGEHMVPIRATLTILQVVADNGTVTKPPRREPIDPRDKIILPDGTTGPIIDTPGAVTDPATGRGFINSVMIGSL